MLRAVFPYLLAITSGAIGVLAFSPFDLWLFIFVSLLGLLALNFYFKKSTALWGSFLWGLSFYSIGLQWVHVSLSEFGGVPLWLSYVAVLLLGAYLALYPLVFAYVVQRFQLKRVILFPVLWLLLDGLRGWLFTGFPWLAVGYSLIDSPLSGIAPLLGVNGLTFVALWLSTLLVSTVIHWQQQRFVWAWGCVGVLGGIVGVSVIVKPLSFATEQPISPLSIRLLQGNIAQDIKWNPEHAWQNFKVYDQLIQQNLGQSDLLILPEAAFPFSENQLVDYFKDLQEKALAKRTQVMIGTTYGDPQHRFYNAVVVLGNPQFPYQLDTSHRYVKHHLVPFGEYVPLEHWLRPLGAVFNLPLSGLTPGAYWQPPLMSHHWAFNVAICYEIIFGQQVQQNLRPDTAFLLTVSNDTWFGRSIGPWQHLQMARMRALELGKPLIRATNNGITAFIDEKGQILAQAPQFEPAVLTHTFTTQWVSQNGFNTPYAKVGDKPLMILSVVWLLIHIFTHVATGWIQRRFRHT